MIFLFIFRGIEMWPGQTTLSPKGPKPAWSGHFGGTNPLLNPDIGWGRHNIWYDMTCWNPVVLKTAKWCFNTKLFSIQYWSPTGQIVVESSNPWLYYICELVVVHARSTRCTASTLQTAHAHVKLQTAPSNLPHSCTTYKYWKHIERWMQPTTNMQQYVNKYKPVSRNSMLPESCIGFCFSLVKFHQTWKWANPTWNLTSNLSKFEDDLYHLAPIQRNS